MNPDDQICTLKQARRLKEFGITQRSYFFINPKGESFEAWMLEGDEDIFVSAYNVPELALMIKSGSKHSEMLWDSMLKLINSGNSCISFFKAAFLADFIINLLESNQVTAEYINDLMK